jgi:hypothetical protein
MKGWLEWLKSNVTMTGIIAVLAFLVAFTALAILLKFIMESFSLSTHGLSVLALGGVIALLGALLIFTTLINLVGLSNRDQALGLPEGSVRALLALALLGLFAILVSSVLNPESEVKTFSGLRQEDVTAFVQHNPDARDIVQTPEANSQPPTFKLTFSSAQRQDDFAKQMLTLVGTLMTAVISFYFGATTVRPTDDSTRRPLTSVATPQVSPNAARPNIPSDFTVTGSGLSGVTQVEAVGPPGTSRVTATNLNVVNDNQITFRLELPAGKWTASIRSGTAAPVNATPEIDVI